MKRLASVILALTLLLSTAALASEIPQISQEMFLNAKLALTCLASGEYERLVTLLPFADVAPSASEWRSFSEGNFTTFDDGIVQTDYAVAYWTGFGWNLAIPTTEPDADHIETLVLTSTDGVYFTGYRFATWAEIKGEYLFAPYVIWDKEFISTAPIIAKD